VNDISTLKLAQQSEPFTQVMWGCEGRTSVEASQTHMPPSKVVPPTEMSTGGSRTKGGVIEKERLKTE